MVPSNIPLDSPKVGYLLSLEQLTCWMSQELYESYFVFALVWAYGSCLFNDGQTDYRAEFRWTCPDIFWSQNFINSKWFLVEFGKNLSFPSGASVFDVWIDPNSQEFVSWNERCCENQPLLSYASFTGFPSLTWTRTCPFKHVSFTTPRQSE